MINFVGIEFINLVVLFTKVNILVSLNAFSTQIAIITLTSLYFVNIIQPDRQFKLREILSDAQAPPITWRNRTNKFAERMGVHKLNRAIYICFRANYVCFIYYFGPNIFILFNQFRVLLTDFIAKINDAKL